MYCKVNHNIIERRWKYFSSMHIVFATSFSNTFSLLLSITHRQSLWKIHITERLHVLDHLQDLLLLLATIVALGHNNHGTSPTKLHSLRSSQLLIFELYAFGSFILDNFLQKICFSALKKLWSASGSFAFFSSLVAYA